MVASSVNVNRWLLVGLVAGVWAMVAQHWVAEARADAGSAPSAQKAVARFDEIEVHRINVVEDDGTARLVIANSARFPNPVVRGKELPRSISGTAGMVFYDAEGVETGGLASAQRANGQRANALIFDYNAQPTDGIGLVKTENADGSRFAAGLTVADPRPFKPGPIESSEGISRIWLGNQDKDARLEIYDTQGRPRVRIGVGRDDVPALELLDAAGKVVRRIDAG